MVKNIFWGILSGIAFWAIVTFILSPIGEMMFAGGPFTLSYHVFSYMSAILLCVVIIVCTLTIVQKVKALNELVIKRKK